MAINNIPGVGPSNADVANAVAAVVPDSADITAAVPTAAQIATAVAAPSASTIAAAVAAPSAATIAAAVAAPSAATIASAVAAPSAATIASAVAAAVPTTAGITSIVQANAGSPFGGSWTLLSSQNPNATTVTFSGLSGYKKYRLYFNSYSNAGNYSVSLRINNLQGTTYAYATKGSLSGGTTAFSNTLQGNSSLIDLAPSNVYQGFTCFGFIDFDQASSGQYKTVDYRGGFVQAGTVRSTVVETAAFARETAAINRIDIFSNLSFQAITESGFWLFGGN